MLSEYGVGTVDQALLSVLNVKHQFVRLWGLANRTVVIDEVHAYDVYTSGLIMNLVRWLRALGSSVILMSATLPASRRKQLVDTFGAQMPDGVPYPRITQVLEGRVVVRTFDSRPLPRLEVRSAPQQVDPLANALLDSVAGGGCAACVVNTVQRAQDLFTRLQGITPGDVELLLFHARFPAEDRQKIEDDVFQKFGPGSDYRPQKAVLVGTQVIEQSIDLDFDTMFTDLAPLDLILQRAGRLHRHPRMRPVGLATPGLFVAGLSHNGALPDIWADHWDKIYEPYVLFRSWLALRRRRGIRLPEEVEPLVDSVYEDDRVPADLTEDARKTIEHARDAMKGRIAIENAMVLKAVIGEPEAYTRNSPPQIPLEDEEDQALHPMLRALTRLGERSLTVIPLHELEGGTYLDSAAQTRVRLSVQPTYEEAKRLFLRSVTLSRASIVAALAGEHVPSGWAKHPLLRHCRPLFLRSNSAFVGDTQIVLDPALGIVYRVAGEEK
jgi:CRISPR-associated endonuclease/helicase Cas3